MTNALDYSTFVEGGWVHFGLVTVLSSLRIFGAWTLLPLLSTQALGGTLIRNSLMFMLSTPVLLHYWEDPAIRAFSYQLGLTELFFLVFKEVFIGVLMGFMATIPFWALDAGCFLIDTLRGTSMAVLLNPLLGTQSSILGMFFSHLISVLFLTHGGCHLLLVNLYRSYALAPLGSQLSFSSEAALTFLKTEWSLLYALAVNFALPALLMMFVIDIALGLMNRAATQLNVFFIAMPIKSALCFFLLAVSLGFSLELYFSAMLKNDIRFLLLFPGKSV